MSFVYFNPNPYGKSVGDCVVRALTRVDGSGDWTSTYLRICAVGALVGDMPSANKVWGDYLLRIGFKRYFLPDTCPDCYTIRDFCADHPNGTYEVPDGVDGYSPVTVALPEYEGAYMVEPSTEEQTLATAGKVMAQDVTVKAPTTETWMFTLDDDTEVTKVVGVYGN